MSAEKVIKAIKKYSKFLICSHINLEGDALGSELALASLLRKLGKTAYIVNSDKPSPNYSFLPRVKMIYSASRFRASSRAAQGAYRRLSGPNFQAAFIIDCADRQRIGNVAELIDCEKSIINIDHHIDNENFGQINWIDPQASSTGEMIYRLFKLSKTKLDRKDALNIFTAILTDSGCFRHSNTTPAALYIASELLKFGLYPAKIYERIYESNSVQDMTFVAKVISKISFGANNKIAWAKISRLNFKRIKHRPKILDKVLDFAKSINTVKVVIIFSQVAPRHIKLSFRSKSPINVQKVANLFGGGGHKYASGCMIKGSLREVEKKVLPEVKKALNGWKAKR